MTKNVMAILAALGLTAGMAGNVHAVTNFVQNGDFEILTTTLNGSTPGSSGQLNSKTYATNWTSNLFAAGTPGYNFVYTTAPNTTSGTKADNGGAPNHSNQTVTLWGPGSGSNNGLTLSPTGGNFVAADGAFQQGSITQTITGLTIGQNYAVGFWWAATQQTGFTGATTDLWKVGLDPVGQPVTNFHKTGTINLPSHGFSGWQFQSFNYTATNSTEVLSFLTTGTPGAPNGLPPFALLDGVTMISTPEPSTFVTMGIGALVLGFIVSRRLRTKKVIA